MASSGSVKTTAYNGRYLMLSWSQISQSITDNTTIISWTLKGAGSASFEWCYAQNFKVIINGVTVFTKSIDDGQVKLYDGTVVASGKLTIAHNSDGTKTFSASVAAGIYNWSPTNTGSATFELNRIARASTLSTKNGTLGSAQTLTVNKQDTAFSHTISYICGNTNGTVCTKSTNASISWTPPISLANQNTKGTSVSITFTVTTYSGNTNVGTTSKTISCIIPDSVKPSCTITTSRVALINDQYPSSWWQNKQIYIQGLTKINVVVTASESYGSSIVSYTTKMEGKVYNGKNVTLAAPKGSGQISITTTVKDGRGRTATATKTITVERCAQCQAISLVGSRCDIDGSLNDRGEYIWIQSEFKSGYCVSNNDGKCRTTYYYKKSNSNSWIELNSATLEDVGVWPYTNADEKTNFIFAADTASSYDLKMKVTDYFNSSSIIAKTPTAYSLMHWNTSGKAMSIGKTSELDNVLDIGMLTRHYGGILPLNLESETDLNDIKTPNNYVGLASLLSTYKNTPITSGSFSLEVISIGTNGEVKQRVTGTNSKTYERIFEHTLSNSWCEWVCVSDYGGSLLWSGSWYMNATQNVPLSSKISDQVHGIVLVFSEFNDVSPGSALDKSWHTFFVPKQLVKLKPNQTHMYHMITSDLLYFATKCLYISDTSITGHADNGMVKTSNFGLSCRNTRFALRYVIGI